MGLHVDLHAILQHALLTPVEAECKEVRQLGGDACRYRGAAPGMGNLVEGCKVVLCRRPGMLACPSHASKSANRQVLHDERSAYSH